MRELLEHVANSWSSVPFYGTNDTFKDGKCSSLMPDASLSRRGEICDAKCVFVTIFLDLGMKPFRAVRNRRKCFYGAHFVGEIQDRYRVAVLNSEELRTKIGFPF